MNDKELSKVQIIDSRNLFPLLAATRCTIISGNFTISHILPGHPAVRFPETFDFVKYNSPVNPLLRLFRNTLSIKNFHDGPSSA